MPPASRLMAEGGTPTQHMRMSVTADPNDMPKAMDSPRTQRNAAVSLEASKVHSLTTANKAPASDDGQQGLLASARWRPLLTKLRSPCAGFVGLSSAVYIAMKQEVPSLRELV